MSFFKSSKSNLDQVEAECQDIATKAAEIRDRCDRSLRGKFENMMPEDRAALLKEAAALAKKVRASYATALDRKKAMESDQSTSEDRLKAESRLVAARLDVDRTAQSIEEAKQSLVAGMGEIEQFYGPRSPEAKQIRRVIDDLSQS